MDVFLGVEGGQEWNLGPHSRGRVFFQQRRSAGRWGAFDLQRQIVERYQVAGPFRAIVAVASTAGAVLGQLGAGQTEPEP